MTATTLTDMTPPESAPRRTRAAKKRAAAVDDTAASSGAAGAAGAAGTAAAPTKKTLRGRLEHLLSRNINEIDASNLQVADAIAHALIEKALTGDVRAFEAIRDITGEKTGRQDGVSGRLVVTWKPSA